MLRWLTLFLFLNNLLNAQSVSVLKDSLQQSENKEYIYYLIAQNYLKQGQNDSALLHFQNALKAYKSKNHSLGIAAMHNNMGVVNFQTGNIDSAIHHYSEAGKYYILNKDTLTYASTKVNIGIAYKEVGAYTKALQYLLEAVKWQENIEPTLNLASTYNAIANVLSRQSDFNKSITYHKKAFAIRSKLNDKKGLSSTFNNLGIIYRKLSLYDSALFFFKESLSIKEELQNSALMASTLNNIGLVLVNQSKYKEAKNQFERALSLRPNNSDPIGQAITYNNLARVYLKTNQAEDAIKMLNDASKIIQNKGLLPEMIENMALQVEAAIAVGNEKSALVVYETLLDLKDSLLNQEKIKSLAEMQTKYETEKKEQEIQYLKKEQQLKEAEIQLNRLWILVLSMVGILVLLVGILVYSKFRFERKRKKKIQSLMQELHHRVKNNLQLLSSIFSLQSRVITDKGALDAVRSSENRVNAMAIIHQKLYNRKSASSLNTKAYFEDLLIQLTESFGYDPNQKNFDYNIQSIELDVDIVIPLGLILNEVVSNSFKYAFMQNNDTYLKVGISKMHNDLEVLVTDNGDGFDESKLNDKSMGLNIINTLSRQLRAETHWQTSDGVSFYLKMHLDNG